MTTREFIETIRQLVECDELAAALDFSNQAFPQVADRLSLDEENVVAGLVEYAMMAVDARASRGARQNGTSGSDRPATFPHRRPAARKPRSTTSASP